MQAGEWLLMRSNILQLAYKIKFQSRVSFDFELERERGNMQITAK